MDNIRKLSLTLSILCVALVLTVCTLGLVLVSGTQGVITDLDIHYAGKSNAVKVVVGDTCANSKTIVTKEFKVGDTVQYSDLSIPQTPNKVFLGWYIDENLNTQATFPYALQDITTLYAGYLDASDCLEYTYSSGKYEVAITSAYNSTSYPELVIPGYYDDGTNGVLRVCVTDNTSITTVENKLVFGNLLLDAFSLDFSENASLEAIYMYDTQCTSRTISNLVGKVVYRRPQGFNLYMYGTSNDISFDNCYINNISFPTGIDGYNGISFSNCEFLGTEIFIPAAIKSLSFSSCSTSTIQTVTFENPNNWYNSFDETVDVSDVAANVNLLFDTSDGRLVQR